MPSLLIILIYDPTYKMSFYPWADIKANPNIIAAITPRGAHGHFVCGWDRHRWFKKPMVKFLEAVDQFDKDKFLENIAKNDLTI